MNNKGRQNENNEAVRRLVNNKQELSNTEYLIIDDLQNLILVDVELGTTYTVDSEYNITECNTGDKSKKQNGYVYTELYLNINNEIKKVNYGTHSLIAMCAYTEQYDSLVNNNIVPVVNHKNNTPWDNSKDNLEWTSQTLNRLHGRLVYSLAEQDKGYWLEIMTGYKWTEVKHNLSDIDYITLVHSISCKDIERYEQYILSTNRDKKIKKITDFWKIKLTDDSSLIDGYKLKLFLSWYMKQYNISEVA